MASIDVGKISSDMLAAVLGVFKADVPGIKGYAEVECEKLARTLAGIEKSHLAGEITEAEAKILLDMQKNATRSVFLTCQGLGSIAVEKAINAALDVVKGSVNKALGWALL